MLRCTRSALGLLVLGCVLGMAPPAQAEQTFSFNIGYFALKAEDARADGDVLVENLNFLSFNLKDFNNLALGGDWHVNLGPYLEAGAGVGYYRRTVPSIYARFVNRDGSEIEQDMKLRIIPVTATVRVLPLGHTARVQPYVGGGIGLYSWRYSETGEFVDFRDNSIFRDRFVANGNDVGPVFLAGVRAPVGLHWMVGGELRHQRAEGHVGVETGFAEDRIDLGGYTAHFTVHVRY